MVNQTVKGSLYWLYFIGLLISTTSFSAEVTRLNIIVDKQQVEMGKYLSVRIIYIGNHVPDGSHLEKWYDDFFVQRQEIETETLPGELIQTTELIRLYPRSTGNKVLHSITQGGTIARPVKIKVIPLVRNKIDADTHWQLLPETIWQGETIKVSIIQNLLDSSNQIVIEDIQFPAFFTQSLKQEKIIQNNQARIRLNWLITAQSPGVFQLDAPAVVQRGRSRWRFYLPRVQLKVKPLPSYIPPTVPVGKLSIQSGLFYKEKQAFWFVELQNEGQLPEEIYSVRTQLSELTGQPVEYVTLSTPKKNHQISFNDVHRYQVPVPEWTWGFTDGPEITIPYFNVVEGKIHTLSNKLPGVWNIPKTGRYLLLMTLLCIIVMCLLMLFRLFRNIQEWRSFHNELKKSNTPHELRQVLLTHGSFSTLGEWSKAKKFCLTEKAAKKVAQQLNRYCFARSVKPVHFEVTMTEIKASLAQLHSLKHWLQFNQ